MIYSEKDTSAKYEICQKFKQCILSIIPTYKNDCPILSDQAGSLVSEKKQQQMNDLQGGYSENYRNQTYSFSTIVFPIRYGLLVQIAFMRFKSALLYLINHNLLQ